MFRIPSIRAVRTLFHHKCLSTTAAPPVPVVELQEFQINPAHVWKYTQYAKSQSALRRQLLPLRLFALPEIGGTLNIASHFYYYEKGIEEQQSVRKQIFENRAWQQFLMESRVWLCEQVSSTTTQRTCTLYHRSYHPSIALILLILHHLTAC